MGKKVCLVGRVTVKNSIFMHWHRSRFFTTPAFSLKLTINDDVFRTNVITPLDYERRRLRYRTSEQLSQPHYIVKAMGE